MACKVIHGMLRNVNARQLIQRNKDSWCGLFTLEPALAPGTGFGCETGPGICDPTTLKPRILEMVEVSKRYLQARNAENDLRAQKSDLYDTIKENRVQVTIEDKKVSLLKVVINLILEASEKLSSNSMLFQKIFEIAKDQRSDKNMIENVLWLATSLCE